MENKNKTIYLSGKISGDENYKEKFAAKEKELTEQGYMVYNPAKHPNMFSWEQFMELDLLALKNCDSIYLLEDWKDSRGAKIEYEEAVRLGKEVIYDEIHSKTKDSRASGTEENLEKAEPDSPDSDFSRMAKEYVRNLADKGNFDVENFGRAYFSESSMEKAWLSAFEAGRNFERRQALELEKQKSDQRLAVSYKVDGEDRNIQVQLSEYVSWKFRVALDDHSVTPWQYYGKKPEANDFIDVKAYYEKQQERKNKVLENTQVPAEVAEETVTQKQAGQKDSVPNNLSGYFMSLDPLDPNNNFLERMKDISHLITSDDSLVSYQKISKLMDMRIGISNNRLIVSDGKSGMEKFYKPAQKHLNDLIRKEEGKIFSDYIEKLKKSLPTKNRTNRNLILNTSAKVLNKYNDLEKIIINKHLQGHGVISEDKLFNFLKGQISEAKPKKAQKKEPELGR